MFRGGETTRGGEMEVAQNRGITGNGVFSGQFWAGKGWFIVHMEWGRFGETAEVVAEWWCGTRWRGRETKRG